MANRTRTRKNPTKKSDGIDRLTRSGLIPGNPGNSGGKPGRSGRPPNAFKKFCRELASSPEYQDAIKRAATDDLHDNFAAAAKLVASLAVPKAPKKTKHSGSVTVRVVRQQRSFNGRHADN